MRIPALGNLAVAASLVLAACATTAPPARNGFDAGALRAIDAAVEGAIAAGKLPGGVFWLERDGAVYHRAWGRRAVLPADEPMTESTIFDAASLTKVAATTPSIWILIERGKIGLDQHVSALIPEFSGGWRDEITVRHLLTHTSGLRPDVDLDQPWFGAGTGIRLAIAETPRTRPGLVFRYSDINFLLLGEIVKRASGVPLDEFARREVFGPLKMRDTRFFRCTPSGSPGAPCVATPPIPVATLARIAPTEVTPAGMLRGAVHDPTARRMGGVAGHAGLFTTASDLARYARMLLSGGELDGRRILKPETVKMLTSSLSPAGVAVRRAGGFDLDSGFSRPRGDLFPIGSFGHTGFTGGFTWIDPWSRTFYVFMSNRVHPNGRGNVGALQRALGTLAARAAGVPPATAPVPWPASTAQATTPGAPWKHCWPQGPTIAAGIDPRCPRLDWITGGADAMNGIDVLQASGFKALQGKRVGLITNHTGIDRAGNPTIDLLRAAPGVELAALFSPEHGIRGNADEAVGDTTDEISGLPIFSLYGERRKPSAEQLARIDVLVFDIQDVGARFYTYISTLGLAMEAAAEAKKAFLVLDRVNPIGGESVEGPIAAGEPSFIAFHPIPVRHGMTVGELALMVKAEKRLELDLEVVSVRGWKRSMWQDDAGLPWIDTSPNLRNLNEAGLYPGVALLESAISVGRGTESPFEVVGAPYIDGEDLARALTALGLRGVTITPIRFTPTASNFANQECGGVRFTVTDRHALQAVKLGVALATTLRRLYGEAFPVEKMAHLLRQPAVLEAIRAAKPLDEIEALWLPDQSAFRERRAPFLLY